MDSRAESILQEIVHPQEPPLSMTHTTWMKRELIKLLHKELDVAKREELLKHQERGRKKSNPLIKNDAPN